MGRTFTVFSLGEEDPLEKGMATHSSTLAGESPWTEWDAVQGVPKGSDMTEWQHFRLFPSGTGGKESTCNTGDLGSILFSGRSPGVGNDNLLQYAGRRIPWTEEPGGL